MQDQAGNVSAILALCLIPLIGAFGLGTEVSGWWLLQRNLQNAADTAVLAAATTNDTTSSCSSSNPATYFCEAKAAAAQYGFNDGSGNVTVTPAYLTSGCPGGVSACYRVTVSKTVPLYLTPVVGYRGSGGNGVQLVSAVAYARKGVNPRTYCVLSLVQGDGSNVTTTSTDGITADGSSKTVPQGCNMFSDGSAVCNGHQIADYVDAVGTVGGGGGGCAVDQASGNSTPVTDATYRALAKNIPPITSTSCGAAGVSGNTIGTGGSVTLPASCTFVGDVTLPKNATVTVTTPATASGGSVIYIKDGTLNLNGGTLRTASGSGLTVVFTGSGAASGVSYYPTGGGTLDIAAPTGGTWSGVALYQDPAMPAGSQLDITYKGNTPTWDITGLVYAPNANITMKGTINKSSNGYQCIALVDKTYYQNGATGLYDNPLAQCSQAGLPPPESSKPESIGLVQ